MAKADFFEGEQEQSMLSLGALAGFHELETTLPKFLAGLEGEVVVEAQLQHVVDFSVCGENPGAAVVFQKLIALGDGDHGIHAGRQQSLFDVGGIQLIQLRAVEGHGATLVAARRSSQARS